MSKLHELARKWSPLTEGMGKREGDLVAWAMEREAKHLRAAVEGNDVSDPRRRELKYIFPVLRRVLPRITVLEMIAFDEPHQLWGHIQSLIDEEMLAVLDAEASMGGHYLIPDPPFNKDLFEGMAARIVESIRAFPG